MAFSQQYSTYGKFIDLENLSGSSLPVTKGALYLNGAAGAEVLQANTALAVTGTVTVTTGLLPDANDGAYLGSTTRQFSDLFLAEGAVINFDNGDFTMTQTNNLLALAGGNTRVERLEIDSANDYLDVSTNLQVIAAADIILDPGGNNVLPGSDNADALGAAGTAWSDLFLGDGAVINFDSGDMTITNASNELQVDGGDLVMEGTNKFALGGAPSTDYIQKDTDVKVVAAADIVLDPAGGNVHPGSNDGAALGVAGTGWSDLFLASGAVLNFHSGDVTITHSANALVFDGGGVTFNDNVTLGNATSDVITAAGQLTASAGITTPDIFVASGSAKALEIKEGANNYLTFVTNQSSGGAITVGGNDFSGIFPSVDSTVTLGAHSAAGRFAWSKLHVDNIDLDGQGRIDLDDDQDTSIRASADDVITFEAGGVDALSVKATGLHIVDDLAVHFGTGDDAKIEYDENGTDQLRIHQPAAGVVIAGTNPKLVLGDAGAEDTMLAFDGNAVDYHVALDDSADKLVIGKGTAAGTTTALSIDTNAHVTATHFTASYAKIDILDVNEINSVTKTETTLEVVDKIITVASGSNSSNSNGAGLKFGGTDSDTVGSVLYNHNSGNGGTIDFNVGGTSHVKLGSGSLSPAADNGCALGNVNLAWSDVFLNTGGVINFENGDVTMTHSSNLLNIAGGNTRVARLEVDSASDYIDVSTNLQVIAAADIVLDPGGNNVLPGSDNADALGAAGTAWSDLFLGDGAVINFDSGDMTITNASNELQVDGGDLVMEGTNKLGLGGAPGTDYIQKDTDVKVVAAADIVLSAAGANIKPGSNDQCALGVSGTAFSDLFLASGAVINFAAGNVTATHSSGKLTFNTGTSLQAASFITYSDERLKDNIETLDNALDTVQRLRGVSYDWKADGSPDIGFIAQEVKNVVPALVHGSDEKGYAMDYPSMNALLVEAVKQQQGQIENLRKIVESLKDK